MPIYDEREITRYLGEIGVGHPISARVFELIEEYKSLMDQDPEFVFVENTINNEGISDFPNLGLFSGTTYGDIHITAPNSPLRLINFLNNIDRIGFESHEGMTFREIG